MRAVQPWKNFIMGGDYDGTQSSSANTVCDERRLGNSKQDVYKRQPLPLSAMTFAASERVMGVPVEMALSTLAALKM